MTAGTSMETPFFSGVIALPSKRKECLGLFYRAGRDLLQTIAKYLPEARTEGALLQTAAFQGASLVEVINGVKRSRHDISRLEPLHFYWRSSFSKIRFRYRRFPRTITIGANRTKSFEVIIKPPRVDPSKIPVYSGYIEIASQSGEALSVTSMGITSKHRDATINDNTDFNFGFNLSSLLDHGGVPHYRGTTKHIRW
ncbi:hypothetical protein CPB86DRAFT_800926 [Serendipita vermifera]|nr:hypothetical protein CPB86DRAFT_800926 [Serendipita vermifera]